MDTVEKIFLDCLKTYNKKDMEFAINRNISLMNLIRQFIPPVIINIFKLSGSLSKSDSLFTNENMINYLKLQRPDLAEVILNNMAGKRWLDKQIKDVKRAFL